MADMIRSAHLQLAYQRTDPLGEATIEKVDVPLAASNWRNILVEKIPADADLEQLYVAAKKDKDNDYVFLVCENGDRYVLYGHELDARKGVIGLPQKGLITIDEGHGDVISGVVVNSIDNWQNGDWEDLCYGLAVAGVVTGAAAAGPTQAIITVLPVFAALELHDQDVNSGYQNTRPSPILDNYTRGPAGKKLLEDGIAPKSRK